MGVGRVVPGNEAAETWNRTVPCSGRYWYDRCKRLACMYLRRYVRLRWSMGRLGSKTDVELRIAIIRMI